jgi:hypothetical protein
MPENTSTMASDTSAPANKTSTSIIPDSKPQDIFSILDLPRAIRDMIFDRLLNKVIIRAQSYNIKLQASYGSTRSAIGNMMTQGLPKWLSTNK